jgi:simple sugar transport system substrate-binding protein
VSLNAGGDVSKQLGAFTHFGSNENIAGNAVGERLAKDGVKHPICVIQEQGNVALDARCAGVKEKAPGTENLFVTGTDMSQVSSTVTAKLQATPEADAVIGLAAPITLNVIKAVDTAGSKAKVVSFDMNAELGKAINDGKVAFTVDQQPWLQGYGSVDSLWQYKRGGFKIGGGQPVLTGPAIIDSSNIADVLKFAQQGIR